VHRDVKPDNILVNASGEVRLIDFALAQRSGGGRFLRKRKCQGTRSYMSPEQILCHPLDGRADIYSYAAAAYELVTGRPPFRAADSNDLLRKHLTEKPISPEVHNPQVTKEFADFVLNMLAKKKQDRPNDFHVVLMKLKNIKLFKAVQASASTG
jgi:serine/threonine protein kinase